MTRTEKQNALLPAVTQADDAARLCGQALASLDTGTAALLVRTVGTSGPLDAAAVLIKEAKGKLHAAHKLICGVAMGE